MTDPTPQDIIARLARHRALGSAPPAEHAWLAARGRLRSLEVGAVMVPKGVPAQELIVVFSGRLVLRMDRGAGAQKIIEYQGGELGGVFPYSRGAVPPNDVVAEEPTEVLAVPREALDAIIHECPVITATLVHAMVDRARQFTSIDLRDEKLISLGKLAAGLAHELNNPASAAVRSAKLLGESLHASEEAARRLGSARLSDAQLAAIDAVRDLCAGAPGAPLGPIERADREDAIAEWLAAHGGSERCAGPLADTSVSIDALDRLAASVGGDALDATLRWLAAGCQVRALSSSIETSATRIHELVAAVKGFAYMDRAPTPEPVDIRRGIADTFTMLATKARARSAQVSTELPDDLPKVQAVGAELNQVWMNLIDNALDAIGPGGHVRVTAARELDRVVVSIIDDGPGIPPAIQRRIFDPFYTTKGVGQGTGLGLDIVRRLLQRLDGGVSLESVPGRTEFQVRLPAAP